MKLTISKNANINYLAKIVKIETFKEHPNADKLKLAVVDGCVISVSKDTKPGIFIYFPIECQINSEFLKYNNLFREKTLNKNPDVNPGFFEENGRVKCIKLRGLASEGLIMPISSLQRMITLPENIDSLIGIEFDMVDEHQLVKKYIPKRKLQQGSGQGKKRNKEQKYEDLIIEDQFRFHDDTAMFKKNLHQFDLKTVIHISDKWHGTSAIFCNLLVKKKLSFWQKTLKALGANVVMTEYKTFCSSRKVIKDPTLNKGLKQGYYNVDIWNLALEVIKPYLNKGMTMYAEVVGYLPNGTYIQKDYDYGCQYLPEIYNYNEMTPQQMYEKGLFKILVYRITYTNVDGKVFEMSAKNLQHYCRQYLLTPVVERFYGTVETYMDYHAIGPYTLENWSDMFLETLSAEFLEQDCTFCKNKVPAEGVVIRIDKPKFEAYKLKSLKFYERETKMLDAGEVDIETEES